MDKGGPQKKPGGGLLVFLLKSAKLFKVLKFGKILITLGTMFLSVLVYSLRFGFEFALGFVIMLFIHEMGHVAIIKRRGYPVNAPVFIPMLGAVIYMPPCKSSEEEAHIGIGGPLLGGIASFSLFTYWLLMPVKSDMILFLSYVSTFINLFNLIPIRPLDGGRVTQAVGGWVKYVGLVALLMFTLLSGDPSMVFIWIIVVGDSNLPNRTKAKLGLLAQVLMTMLMVAGVGHSGALVSCIYICLATLLNLLLCFGAERNTDAPTSDNRTYPKNPLSIRIKWGLIYLCLTVGLFTLLHAQLDFVHEIIRK
jgi:Zn-dependent protease